VALEKYSEIYYYRDSNVLVRIITGSDKDILFGIPGKPAFPFPESTTTGHNPEGYFSC